jgi:hypothetical protein
VHFLVFPDKEKAIIDTCKNNEKVPTFSMQENNSVNYGGYFVPIYYLSSFRYVVVKRRQNDNYLFSPLKDDKTIRRQNN